MDRLRPAYGAYIAAIVTCWVITAMVTLNLFDQIVHVALSPWSLLKIRVRK
jgi:hypothetical protein